MRPQGIEEDRNGNVAILYYWALPLLTGLGTDAARSATNSHAGPHWHPGSIAGYGGSTAMAVQGKAMHSQR